MTPTLTAEEWRARLEEQLEVRRDRIDLYSRYYSGEHRLAFATSKFREAFGELFEAFATNWCGLVVDVAVERLRIQGFRFGGDEADSDAWSMWQANGMDALSIIAHTEAVKCEAAYLLVGPPPEGSKWPKISVESPFQVYVECDPNDRTKRLAAIKKYADWNGDTVEIVYLPDKIVTFRRRAEPPATTSIFGITLPAAVPAWDTVSSVPNPLGKVLMIPVENAPDMLLGGTSDLQPAVALNDAANKFFSDMIHASEFTSFPQRVLTGVELPRDPVTNEVVPDAQLRAAVSRLWAFESADAKVFDMAAGDLSNYVAGVDLAVKHIAAQTRTPPHYLIAELANLSADALKAAESGLVARVRRKQIDFSDSWETAVRLGFEWMARASAREGVDGGYLLERANAFDAETIWASAESRDPATVSASLVNKQAIGVPWLALMEEAGYSPQQIERMKRWREAELDEQAARDALAQARATVQAEAESLSGETLPVEA